MMQITLFNHAAGADGLSIKPDEAPKPVAYLFKARLASGPNPPPFFASLHAVGLSTAGRWHRWALGTQETWKSSFSSSKREYRSENLKQQTRLPRCTSYPLLLSSVAVFLNCIRLPFICGARAWKPPEQLRVAASRVLALFPTLATRGRGRIRPQLQNGGKGGGWAHASEHGNLSFKSVQPKHCGTHRHSASIPAAEGGDSSRTSDWSCPRLGPSELPTIKPPGQRELSPRQPCLCPAQHLWRAWPRIGPAGLPASPLGTMQGPGTPAAFLAGGRQCPRRARC